MARYKAVSMMTLKGQTIKEVRHNSDVMDRLNPYNGWTLITESGREFVVWNSMGETNLNEIFREENEVTPVPVDEDLPIFLKPQAE